jgi:Sulfotransferase family
MCSVDAVLSRKRRPSSPPSDRPSDDPGDSAWLSPILVDSTGRDGSTLMMRLLSSSAGIAVPGPYPYEKKYFAYLWRWARILERTDRSDFWTGGDLASLRLNAGKPLIGPPPWGSELMHAAGDGDPSMSRYAFETIWREFSRRATAQVRAEVGDQRADVRYYAEKHQETWLVDLDRLPPIRVLVLLRDPRDVFVSFDAFDAKRRREREGRFVGAVAAPGETEAERIDRFIAHERDRMRWIAGLSSDARWPVFRYEDLVTDLVAQARRLEELLSVSFDPQAVANDAGLRARHVSAESPEASVGRWKRELGPDMVRRLNRELGAELEALGYEPAP